MPAVKRIYRFDKNSGCAVDITPEKDKVVIEELKRDTKQIRKRLKTADVQRTGKYPYESEAMAIDPEDIPKAREIAKSHGVNTEYTRSGEPIITSASHRLQHMLAFGFYDRNGVSSPRNR